jgi:hypothetical protein
MEQDHLRQHKTPQPTSSHKNSDRPLNKSSLILSSKSSLIFFARACNNDTMATNTSPHINEEPEDIFAIPTQQKDEEMMLVGQSKIETVDTRKGGSEMTAAAALTILVGNPDSYPVDETEVIQDEEEEEEKEFEIPQRLTKSGRKRAVPFTLKVRTS